ncbi:hypothetical protein FRB95_010376 [Tulasnella sp. JGI-2019a]|nr:hypothetical protein FRB95_010376 [Tulasnella sp. JGI-2019a]
MHLSFSLYLLCLLQFLSVAWSAPLLPAGTVPRTHTLDRRRIPRTFSELFSRFKLKKAVVDVARKEQNNPKRLSIWKKLAGLFTKKPKPSSTIAVHDGTGTLGGAREIGRSASGGATTAHRSADATIDHVLKYGAIAHESGVNELKLLEKSVDPELRAKARNAMEAYKSAQKRFEKSIKGTNSIVYHTPTHNGWREMPDHFLPEGLPGDLKLPQAP